MNHTKELLTLPQSGLVEVMEKLNWRTICLTFQLTKAGKLPRIKSSGLRGMLGHILLEQAPDLYDAIFELINSDEHPMSRRYQRICSPYILSVPDQQTRFRKGDTFPVYITLIGKAESYFPRLLGLIQNWQGKGLGKENIPLQLSAMSMRQPSPGITLQVPYRLELFLRTPLVLKSEEMGMAGITLPLLVHRMAERVATLAHFHCGADLVTDYSDYIEVAKNAIWSEMDIRKVFWPRYSSRQGQASRIGGWVGKLAFDEVDRRLLPLIHFISHLHMGKCTTWGMGRIGYKLTPIPLTTAHLLGE